MQITLKKTEPFYQGVPARKQKTKQLKGKLIFLHIFCNIFLLSIRRCIRFEVALMTWIRTYITVNDTLYTVGLTKTEKDQEIDHTKLKAIWGFYRTISCLTLIKLGFLKIVFPGAGQFDPLSYSKKNLSNFNITLCNC